MTTTVQTRPKDQLTKSLFERLREFEHAQADIKQRTQDLRNGTLPRQRVPTMTLVERRNLARNVLQQFLEDLTPDETAMLSIMWGSNSWRKEYNDLLDPRHDPAV